jgi:hypothetical protein
LFNIIKGRGSAAFYLLSENKAKKLSAQKAATFSRNDVCRFLLEATDQEWIL